MPTRSTRGGVPGRAGAAAEASDARRAGDPREDDQTGQASVELVALLPAALLVVALAWQGVLAGHAVWGAGAAARAAARAHAVGGDPLRAARAVAAGATVRTSRDGVEVRVRVPSLVGAGLGSVAARARLEPQR